MQSAGMAKAGGEVPPGTPETAGLTQEDLEEYQDLAHVLDTGEADELPLPLSPQLHN